MAAKVKEHLPDDHPFTSEADLWTEMRSRLGKWPDLRIWRQNTGAAMYGDQMVKFGRKGSFDVTGLMRGGRRVEIELKVKNRQPTEDQENNLAMLSEMGALCGVCRSMKEVMALLASGGLHEGEQLAKVGKFWSTTFAE